MHLKEVSLDIENDFVFWNAFSPSVTDSSLGNSISHCIQLAIPINENADASLKQLLPISMD